MTIIQQLSPEIIDLCRPLIFERNQLMELVDMFSEQWRLIIAPTDIPVPKAAPIQPPALEKKESAPEPPPPKKSEDSSDDDDDDDDDDSYDKGPKKGGLRFGFEEPEPEKQERSTDDTSEKESEESEKKGRVSEESEESTAAVSGGTTGPSTVEDDEEKKPMFTVHNLVPSPTDKDIGTSLGMGVSEEVIDMALVTTFQDSRHGMVTKSYKGATWRNMASTAVDVLSRFVTEKEITTQNIALTVVSLSSGMPEEFAEQLKEKMEYYPTLKNVFVTDTVLTNTFALLLAARFDFPKMKFAMTIGQGLEISLVKKMTNDTGKRKRQVLVVEPDYLFNETIDEKIRNDLDDAKATTDELISAKGLPRLFQKYLIVAIQNDILFNGNVSEKLADGQVITFEDMVCLERSPSTENKENTHHSTKSFLHRLGFKKVTESDCIQVEFIARSLARRSCYILACLALALVQYFKRKSMTFVMAGTMVYFPNYLDYFKNALQSIAPEYMELIVEVMARSNASLGAGLLAGMEAKALIRRMDGRRKLPPFNIHPCCICCKKHCQCRGKWA